ncbi:MAG TPA: hypothetical protein VI704_00105 [Bacteroidota bacterium]|nr:hypothetical protein [Bacteroidota bacterium]
MKYKKLRAYLSGGMEYAKGEGADWRSTMELWIKENLKHEVFNPNRESEKFLKRKLPHGSIRELKFNDLDKFSRLLRGVVDLDSKEIAHRSDYVICYWDESAQKGAGTKGEVTIAKFFGKPVFLVTELNRENIPGWVLGCVSSFFSSFDELKAYLSKKYPTRGA